MAVLRRDMSLVVALLAIASLMCVAGWKVTAELE